MSAVEPVVAETSEVPRPPPIVYFWGSVRATVNRVAAEYARRLHAEPVVLVVESTHHRGAAFLIDAGIRPNRLFALRAVEEVQLLPPAPGSEERGALDRRPEEDLQTEAHRVMQLP